MELLTARNLTATRNGRILFGDVGLTLRSSRRLGLVGPNGSGKSTLLRLLAGNQRPDDGVVRTAPGARLSYLAQQQSWRDDQTAWQASLAGLAHTTELERELRAQEVLLAKGQGSLEQYAALHEAFERAGGYAAEALLREMLAALGVPDEQLDEPVGRLSGGERQRLALARTLSGNADILLLDEPTNHLDLPALTWVGERLARWPGALMLISHDRALLDRVCTDIAELKGGELQVMRGGYTTLREQQGVLERGAERRQREHRKRIQRLERTAAELRAWGTAKAQRRRRQLERELASSEEVRLETETVLPRIDSREAHGVLLEARSLSKSLGGLHLFEDLSLSLRAGDKVALVGRNGSGKSTLLRLLAGELSSDDPRSEFWFHRDAKLLHADQQSRGLSHQSPVLEQITSLVNRERAQMLLALSGLPEERRNALPGELSGGERARAGLARLLAAQANVMLLDEPTNDLDLNAIETLHHALASSDAAVVIATHDRALARLADTIWALDEGELVEYRGGLDGYLAGRRKREADIEGVVSRASEVPGAEVPLLELGALPTPGKNGDEVEESELERLELERLGLEERLADPLSLPERERQRLRRRLSQTMDELSLAYDRPLPQPAPSFSVRESGVRVGANVCPQGLCFSTDAPVDMSLLVDDEVGHLMLKEGSDALLLPWTRRALLDGAVRLAFYVLAPRVVQYYSPQPVASRYLTALEPGWWTVALHEFERLEGWSDPEERLETALGKPSSAERAG